MKPTPSSNDGDGRFRLRKTYECIGYSYTILLDAALGDEAAITVHLPPQKGAGKAFEWTFTASQAHLVRDAICAALQSLFDMQWLKVRVEDLRARREK